MLSYSCYSGPWAYPLKLCGANIDNLSGSFEIKPWNEYLVEYNLSYHINIYNHSNISLKNFYFLSNLYTQCRAQTQAPEIKSHMLHQLKQPDAPRLIFLTTYKRQEPSGITLIDLNQISDYLFHQLLIHILISCLSCMQFIIAVFRIRNLCSFLWQLEPA